MYNQEIRDFEKYLTEKYAGNIKAFFETYGMDTGVSLDMLLFNARAFMKGAKSEIIPGGGPVNVAELVADVQRLDELQTKATGIAR